MYVYIIYYIGCIHALKRAAKCARTVVSLQKRLVGAAMLRLLAAERLHLKVTAASDCGVATGRLFYKVICIALT